MSKNDTKPIQLDRPFERMRTTSRQGSAYAQALPHGIPGLYLVAQIDDQGVHVEARERFTSGPGRLRNRRHARITLTSNDASQLGAILQEQASDGDQNGPSAQDLNTQIAAAEIRAEQAIKDRHDANMRFSHIQKVAKKRFQTIKLLRRQLADAARRVQAAEATSAETERQLPQMLGPRSMIKRLRRELQALIAAKKPAIGESSNHHGDSRPSVRKKPNDQSDGNGVSAEDEAQKDAGEQFLAWLKHSIAHELEPINTQKAHIHVLPEGLALVSPKIFRHFRATHWRHVQKRFQKLRLHQRPPTESNIWACLVTRPGEKTASALNVLLIPDAENALGVTLPAPNPHLTLLGQKDATPCA